MAHGEGTVKLVSAPGEPECWEVSVSLGRNPETGKYPRRKRLVRGDYEQACAMRDYLKGEGSEVEDDEACGLESEEPCIELATAPFAAVEAVEAEYLPPSRFVPSSLDGENVTVERLAHMHAERKKTLGKWAKSTEYAYWQYVGRYVVPDLGQLLVAECTTQVIEEYYFFLMNSYRQRKGRSAASIINEIHHHLKAMYTTARRMHLVTENPCDLAERPKYEKPEAGSLTISDMRRLLRILDDMGDDDFTAAVRLYVAGGLRPEEAAGLTWRAVDFDACTVSVVQARTRFESKGPKSKTSRRSVSLDPDTMRHLAACRRSQKAALHALGIEQTADTYVVLGRNGEPINVETMRTRWKRFRAKHDVRTSTGQLATQHQLRHTYASLLVANGAPIPAVSKSLGHKDSVITSRIYVHALPGQQQELSQLYGNLMAG